MPVQHFHQAGELTGNIHFVNACAIVRVMVVISLSRFVPGINQSSKQVCHGGDSHVIIYPPI